MEKANRATRGQAPAYLIDASIYIFRAWFGLPDEWHHPNGMPVNAVYGFTRWLLDFLVEQQPGYVAANFDESLGSCFRNSIYPAYKSSRAYPDESLAFQLQLCQQVCRSLGVRVYASDTFEADDLIASQAARCQQQDIPVVVVSGDKDLAQVLLHSHDRLWDIGRKPAQSPADYSHSMGISSAQLADMQALTGDKVDDIPGVPGVGNKTAVALLQAFGSLDQLLSRTEELAGSGIRGGRGLAIKLDEHRQQIQMARQLTGLRQDIELGAMPKDIAWGGPDNTARALLQESGLAGLLTRLARLGAEQ